MQAEHIVQLGLESAQSVLLRIFDSFGEVFKVL
jgi:hypothetical protein